MHRKKNRVQHQAATGQNWKNTAAAWPNHPNGNSLATARRRSPDKKSKKKSNLPDCLVSDSDFDDDALLAACMALPGN